MNSTPNKSTDDVEHEDHVKPRWSTVALMGVVASVMSAIVFVGLPVLGDVGHSKIAKDRAVASQRDQLESMTMDLPGFIAFRADPIWSSPEWAAITEAQLAEDEAATAVEYRSLNRTRLTSWAVPMAHSNWVIPMDTEPVFSWRTVRPPMVDAFEAGASICSGDDPAAGLAAWTPETDSVYITGFADVWRKNAPVIVEAAVRSICPAELA